MKNQLKTHIDSEYFDLDNPDYRKMVDYYLFGEMERDSGNGDVTTDIFLGSSDKEIEAVVIAKSDGILAGEEEVRYFLDELKVENNWQSQDGDEVGSRQVVLDLKGSAKTILKAERPILNLLGRLSGVATTMSNFVSKVPDTVLVCPTRKTFWGLLDKKACLLGGGGTHRLTAGSAFLAKENHLSLLEDRDVLKLKSVFENTPKDKFGKFCEIEVENEKEAFDACEVLQSIPSDIFGVVMFDNFRPDQIISTIKRLKKSYTNIVFEASGGITLDNISEYGQTGVDVISVGAITHSAQNFDFSLRVV